MVIKVDFDLTMTILAHNMYRLFALDLQRYAHLSDETGMAGAKPGHART